MRTCFLLLCWSFLIRPSAHSQIAPNPDPNAPLETWSWSIGPIATGQASGHIADLTFKNNSTSAAQTPGGPLFIPSDGQYQPYIVPSIKPAELDPGKETTIPVFGYCTDVNKPAAPKGHMLPLPAVLSSGELDWLVHLDRISKSVLEVLHVSAYTTPLHNNPVKEKEVITQQVFWVHTSSLSDKPYGFTEFCESATDLFRESDDAPSSPSGYLDRVLLSEITNLWRIVEEAGTAAEIPAFLSPPVLNDVSPGGQMSAPLFPEIINTIKATGTGRTTGHIADLSVTNPADHPIIVTFGPDDKFADGSNISPGEVLPAGIPMFIPSGGQYQPYIVPSIGPILVEPHRTVITPVEGYCVDIHSPPVPSGTNMPSISDWITTPLVDSPRLNFKPRFVPPVNYVPGEQQIVQPTGLGGGVIVIAPPKLSFSLDQSVEVLSKALPPVSRPVIRWVAGNNVPPIIAEQECVQLFDHYVPTIPGSTTPFPMAVDIGKNPSAAVPLLIDALSRISASYDELKEKAGPSITTPFSGNPEKEREAVIQQTLWLYADALSGSKYTKDDFAGQTIRQFENSTGTTFSGAPQQEQDKINKGVDDFWSTFEAVGVEAKILSVPMPAPVIPTPSVNDFWVDYNTAEAKILD